MTFVKVAKVSVFKDKGPTLTLYLKSGICSFTWNHFKTIQWAPNQQVPIFLEGGL